MSRDTPGGLEVRLVGAGRLPSWSAAPRQEHCLTGLTRRAEESLLAKGRVVA